MGGVGPGPAAAGAHGYGRVLAGYLMPAFVHSAS